MKGGSNQISTATQLQWTEVALTYNDSNRCQQPNTFVKCHRLKKKWKSRAHAPDGERPVPAVPPDRREARPLLASRQADSPERQQKHGGDQRNPRTDQIPQGRRTGTYASAFLCLDASCARRRTYTAWMWAPPPPPLAKISDQASSLRAPAGRERDLGLR